MYVSAWQINKHTAIYFFKKPVLEPWNLINFSEMRIIFLWAVKPAFLYDSVSTATIQSALKAPLLSE